MDRSTIIGVWQLQSCEGRSAEGDSFLPYGERPIGKLIYTTDGHLAVTLMDSTRSPFASEDLSHATSEEIVAAFTTFDSYCGRWHLDPETGRIDHMIEGGRVPNWVGKTHVRTCQVHGSVLTLSTEEFSMGGKIWRVHVRWTRAHQS